MKVILRSKDQGMLIREFDCGSIDMYNEDKICLYHDESTEFPKYIFSLKDTEYVEVQ